MKKEYLIPIVLMLVLGAFLFLKDDNQTHYTLPTPPGVDRTEINRITLKGPDQEITFDKIDDAWTLGPNAYPADASAIKEMIDTLVNLKITALASEKGDVHRYELDGEQAVEVTAFDTDASLIRIKVGKPSVTGNHTFIMLEGDSRIYHAAKNFRKEFNKGMDDYRNKQVLSFKRGNITRFTVETQGVSQTFTANPTTESQEKGDVKSALTFVAADGMPVNAKVISDLLSTLSDLTCQGYPQTPARADLEKSTPKCKITLENGETLVLNLFDQGEKALGTTSTQPYAFELASYTAEDILSYAAKLTRTEPKKEDSTKE